MVTHSRILAWENSMDRGAWWAIVLEVTKNQTRLGTHTHEVYSLVVNRENTTELNEVAKAEY